MKAIVCQQYGSPDVLQLKEVNTPRPRSDELLIKIRATTVTSADCRVRALRVPLGFGLVSRMVFGFSGPRQLVLGTEFAGEVAEVGKRVGRFKVGDQVFGMTGARMGCHAQYTCLHERSPLALKPPNLTCEEVSALSFGGTTALDFFRRGQLRKGDRILINGASGSVGTAAVQLAHHFGAEVTGVCSAANADMVRSLGAKHVIDYTQEDFTHSGKTYDLILDAVGTAPHARSKAALSKHGRLLLLVADLPAMLCIPWVSLTSHHKLIAGPASERVEDLRLLAELVEAGQFQPVVDRVYPFEQTAQAHRYVDTGRKKGNVAISVQHTH